MTLLVAGKTLKRLISTMAVCLTVSILFNNKISKSGLKWFRPDLKNKGNYHDN
jgi:hypothetical protein